MTLTYTVLANTSYKWLLMTTATSNIGLTARYGTRRASLRVQPLMPRLDCGQFQPLLLASPCRGMSLY